MWFWTIVFRFQVLALDEAGSLHASGWNEHASKAHPLSCDLNQNSFQVYEYAHALFHLHMPLSICTCPCPSVHALLHLSSSFLLQRCLSMSLFLLKFDDLPLHQPIPTPEACMFCHWSCLHQPDGRPSRNILVSKVLPVLA